MLGDPAVELVVLRVRPAVAALEFGGDVLIAVFVDQLRQQRAIELFRVHVFEAGLPAPLPVLDQIGKELAAPADAALQEPEVHVGEAPRHPAKEQRLGHRVTGRGKVADMVKGEVARGVAQAEAAAAGVKSRRHLQLAAFLPDRVVVVVAVEA